jgi:hypothetical protein
MKRGIVYCLSDCQLLKKDSAPWISLVSVPLNKVKVTPVSKHHIMKTYRKVEVKLHAFSSLAVEGSE